MRVSRDCFTLNAFGDMPCPPQDGPTRRDALPSKARVRAGTASGDSRRPHKQGPAGVPFDPREREVTLVLAMGLRLRRKKNAHGLENAWKYQDIVLLSRRPLIYVYTFSFSQGGRERLPKC